MLHVAASAPVTSKKKKVVRAVVRAVAIAVDVAVDAAITKKASK